MNSLKEKLILERSRLEDIVTQVETALTNVPEGSLRLSKNKKQVQYYHCTKNGKYNGEYISVLNKDLAIRLAQKEYDNKVLACAQKRLSQIKRMLKDFDDNEIEQIFLNEHPERQKLINPVEPTRQQLVEHWLEKPYKGRGFKDTDPEIYSKRHLRVRSKSERFIADYLDSLGIPYKYECPIYLPPYGIIYPDFTFLSPRTKKEIYWEHEGRMDDPIYAQNAVKKIGLYEKNGIFIGDRLILTFETSQSVLNMDTVREYTNRYLL